MRKTRSSAAGNERLTERLRRAEIIIEVQKEAALLGRPLPEPDPGTTPDARRRRTRCCHGRPARLPGSERAPGFLLRWRQRAHGEIPGQTSHRRANHRPRPPAQRAVSEPRARRRLCHPCSTRASLLDPHHVPAARTTRRIALTPPAPSAYQARTAFATGPNQVWSWDITKLLGPARGPTVPHVILDVFSRYVVGWMWRRAKARTGKRLIDDACRSTTSGQQLTVPRRPRLGDRSSRRPCWPIWA